MSVHFLGFHAPPTLRGEAGENVAQITFPDGNCNATIVVGSVTWLRGNSKAINAAGVWLSMWGRGELADSFCPVSGESRVPFVAALAGV